MYVAEVVKESKEDEANATLIASAPELLALAVGFSSACQERIDILNEDEIYACECWRDDDEDEVTHKKHCDTGDQIAHWKAYKEEIDSAISKAKGNSPS